jgi:hypothetical protein
MVTKAKKNVSVEKKNVSVEKDLKEVEKMKKLKSFTENLTFTAKEKEPKSEILYLRVNTNLTDDLEDMRRYFDIEKRTDLIRAIIEDAIKSFRKIEREEL